MNKKFLTTFLYLLLTTSSSHGMKQIFKYANYHVFQEGIIDAIRDKNIETVKTLTNSFFYTAKLKSKALLCALELDELTEKNIEEKNKIIEILLGDDIDFELDQRNVTGTTLLMQAMMLCQNKALIQMLLEKGADITKTNSFDYSAFVMFYAFYEEALPVLENYIKNYPLKKLPSNIHCPKEFLAVALEFKNIDLAKEIVNKYPNSFMKLWFNPSPLAKKKIEENKIKITDFYNEVFAIPDLKHILLCEILDSKNFAKYITGLSKEHAYDLLNLALKKQSPITKHLLSNVPEIDLFAPYKGFLSLIHYAQHQGLYELYTIRHYGENKIINTFMKAINTNDIERVKNMLQYRSLSYFFQTNLINRMCDTQDTFLSKACSFGHQEIVELLLKQGCDPGAHNGLAWVKTLEAKQKGVFEYLLNYEKSSYSVSHDTAFSSILDSFGDYHDSFSDSLANREKFLHLLHQQLPTMIEQAFIYAIEKNDQKTAKLFTDTGFDCEEIFINAVMADSKDIAQLCMYCKNDILTKNLLARLNSPIEASDDLLIKLFKLYKATGGDINKLVFVTKIPFLSCKPLLIHLMEKKSSEDILRLIIELGADINALDQYQQSAVHYAAYFEHISFSLFKDIWSKTANKYALDRHGKSPLLNAFNGNQHDKIKFLLEQCDANPLPNTMLEELKSGTALLLSLNKKDYDKIRDLLLQTGYFIKKEDFPKIIEKFDPSSYKSFLCYASEDDMNILLQKEVGIILKEKIVDDPKFLEYLNKTHNNTPYEINSEMVLARILDIAKKEKKYLPIAQELSQFIDKENFAAVLEYACSLKSSHHVLKNIVEQINDHEFEDVLKEYLPLILKTMNEAALRCIVPRIFACNGDRKYRLLTRLKKNLGVLQFNFEPVKNFKNSLRTCIMLETLKCAPTDIRFNFQNSEKIRKQ